VCESSEDIVSERNVVVVVVDNHIGLYIARNFRRFVPFWLWSFWSVAVMEMDVSPIATTTQIATDGEVSILNYFPEVGNIPRD